MAVAKLVCGSCGGELSGTDRFCPNCGVAIDGGSPAKGAEPALRDSTSAQCTACGHVNTNPGEYCESCGVRLNVPEALRSRPAGATGSKSPGKTGKATGPRSGREGRTKWSFEPWQVIAAVAIVILAGVLFYYEIVRVSPTLQQRMPGSPPVESSAMIQEIEQQQRAVDANPNDAAALLKLANMLHDAGMQNPQFLARSEDAYQNYLKANPDDPDARVDLGIVYFELARVDTAHSSRLLARAIDEMTTVARKNPKHQPAAFNLGIVNLNGGNTTEAAAWFKKAIEINPGSDLGMRAKRLLEQHSFPSSSN